MFCVYMKVYITLDAIHDAAFIGHTITQRIKYGSLMTDNHHSSLIQPTPPIMYTSVVLLSKDMVVVGKNSEV